MSDVLSQRPRITDLRGAAGVPRGAAVLEDPTGRRRRRLRLVGRVLAALLTLWLVALLLGAVGINPVSGVPLGRALRPTTAPPAQKTVPQPKAPSVADLQPAEPVQTRVSKTAPSTPATVAPRKRALARRPASTKTPLRSSPHSAVPLLSPGANAPPAPPGRDRTTTTPTPGGRSETAPGRTKTAPSPRAGPHSTDTTTTP